MTAVPIPTLAEWYWSRNFDAPVRVFLTRRDVYGEKKPLIRKPNGDEVWLEDIEPDLFVHIRKPDRYDAANSSGKPQGETGGEASSRVAGGQPPEKDAGRPDAPGLAGANAGPGHCDRAGGSGAGEVYTIFSVGNKVSKVGGDYRFDGVVIGVFTKLSGLMRYAVEDDRGVIHIYSEKNLKHR